MLYNKANITNAENNANNIAKGIQTKQKHHHQEILIIFAIFNIHNIAVIKIILKFIFSFIVLSLMVYMLNHIAH